MRIRVWTFVLGAVAALALAAPSRAAIERTGSGIVETIGCNGESVEIGGASNDLTLLGDCPHVEIAGTGNNVRIARAKHIEVGGVNNKVTWAEGISGRPHVESVGLGNSVTQAPLPAAKRSGAAAKGASVNGQSVAVAGDEPAPAGTRRGTRTERSGGPSISVAGNNRTETVDCGGRDVDVSGNHNDLTLKGECGTVSVPGNYNTLSIDAAAAISTPGNFNKVTWSSGVGGKAPRISNVGVRNSVSQQPE
jgi:hypothetical protein